MLGEGLTSGAAVQFMRYDESAVDRPRRGRIRTAIALLGAVVAILAVVFLA